MKKAYAETPGGGIGFSACDRAERSIEEKISAPVLIMRGQWDGIASFQDLANFFARLPNPDKQFVVMPGIAHTSTRSKNWALVYHLLDGYFSQPAPVYTG